VTPVALVAAHLLTPALMPSLLAAEGLQRVAVIAGAVLLALYVVTLFLNVGTAVSQVISDVNRVQRGFSARRPAYPFANEAESEDNVIEGTITDLEEERRKRRRE